MEATVRALPRIGFPVGIPADTVLLHEKEWS